MKPWLKDLLGEYPTKRSDAAIDRLERIFEQYDEETMRQATDLYILEGKYFPKVADMKAYVDHALYQVAQQDSNPRDRYREIQAMDDDEIAQLDGNIQVWEQRRGSMPDDAQLDSEYEECERERAAA